MVSNEIIDLKENFFKELRELEKTFKKNLAEISSSLDENNKQHEEKINLAIQKNEQIYNEMLLEKNNLDKIGQLEISQKKLNDMLISHEVKIKELLTTNKKLNLKYEKILSDNLTVPGFVGPSCIYKNLSEYIQHNIIDIERMKIEKETERKMVEDMKYKSDGLMKTILNLVENSVLRCNRYTDNKHKYIEDILHNKLVEINEKNMDLRTQILTNLYTTNQRVDNFDNQIKDLKEMRETIKIEIDNIMIDFHKKIEDQEKKTENNIHEKITTFKKVLNKMIAEIESNISQATSRQNKYGRKDYKSSTSYSKQVKEKDDLNNLYQIKSSKNINEKSKGDKFSKNRRFLKRKTEVFGVTNNFRFMGIINKIDENNDSSKSIHSQELSIHNTSLEKEKPKEKFLTNENNKNDNRTEDTLYKYKEKKYSVQIKPKINLNAIINSNDFENDELKEDNISKIQKSSRSIIMEEETQFENKQNEKKDIEEIEYNIDNVSEKLNDEKNDNIQNNNNKNEEIIKKETNDLILFPNEKKNNSKKNKEEELSNEIKNVTITNVINKEKENKPKVIQLNRKDIKIRNDSFPKTNSQLNKKDLNSFNNFKTKNNLENLKTEIEKDTILSKSNSNSIDINKIKDKEKFMKKEIIQTNSDRIIFNKTVSKFHVKEQKIINTQTQTAKKTSSNLFPQLNMNFKLINLGSNIYFTRNELRKDNSNEKMKENKKIDIDLSSPLTNVYKAYQKQKSESKHNNINLNIFKKNISANKTKKFLLKGESINYSISNNKKIVNTVDNNDMIK